MRRIREASKRYRREVGKGIVARVPKRPLKGSEWLKELEGLGLDFVKGVRKGMRAR